MAQYTKQQLISASNAAYFTNVYGGISASAVRDLNDSWISSSALLSGSNTFIGNQIISGNLDISGTITASLQTGYLYVGNGSGKTEAVATSSIVTNINTGSFATTGSNTFTGNQTISGALYQSGTFYPDQIDWISSSIQQGTGSYILTTDNNGVTQYDNFQNIAAALQPYIQTGSVINTGSFATTGSNVFFGSETFNVGVSDTFRVNWGSASSASMYTENSSGPNQTLNINSASLYLNRGGLFFPSGSFTSQIGDMQFNAYPSASFTIRTQYGGNAILRANTDYTDGNRNYSYFQASPDGQINIVGKGDAVIITGSLGTTIQGLKYPSTDGTAGQVLTTDGSKNLTFTTITGSGGSTDTGSLLVTASFNDTTRDITFTKGDATTFKLGGFATTGSNTFNGNQTITGAVTISGSASLDLIVYGNVRVGVSPVYGASNQNTLNLSPTSFVLTRLNENQLGFTYDNITEKPVISAFNTGSISYTAIQFQSTASYTDGRVTFPRPIVGLQNLELTGSLTASLQQGYAWVGDSNNRTTLVATSSFGSSIDTGSFATTGSNTFRGNQTLVSSSIAIQGSGNLSFPNGLSFSGNSGDISSISAASTIQLITEPPAGPGGEGNSIKFINRVSGSFIQFDNQQAGAGNPINFIGGAAGFTLNVVSGSTGKLNINAQGGIDATNSTFTASLANGYVWVGNGSNYTTVVATSSFAGSSINTGSFATTGSNVFTGDQTISKNGGVYNIIDNSNPSFGTASFGISGASGGLIFKQSGSTVMEGSLSPFGLTFYPTASFNTGIKISDSDFTQGGTIIYNTTSKTFRMLDESAATSNLDLEGTFTASLAQGYAWVGNSSNVSSLVATSSFGSSINTGSFATTGSNNFVGVETINNVAGTGVGEVYLLGRSGSLVLGASAFTPTYAALSHLSSSATTNVNLIFKSNTNTEDTIISGSNNIFVNPSSPNPGFKRYVGRSGNIVLNAFNVPQISGSMAFSPTMNNNYFGGNSTAFQMTGPVSSSAWTISGNNVLGTVNIGSSAALNAEKIVSGLTMTGNNIAGNFNLIANQSALSSNVSFTNNILAGTATLNLSSSAVGMSNNIINDSGFTFTNQYYTGSLGLGTVAMNRNTIGGQNNSIIISGSLPVGGVASNSISDNFIFGGTNTIYIDVQNARLSGSSVYKNVIRTGLMGNNLIVSGSSLLADASSYGSVFVGRYNANDNRRNKTSDNVFAVGTGNSTTRKTGFLIDSGSNSYFEGTLNVSGSTTMTGSLTISSSATYDLIVKDSMVVSGSNGAVYLSPAGFRTANTGTDIASYVNQYSIAQSNTTTADELGFTLDTDAYGVSGWSGPAIYGNDPSDLYPAFLGFQNKSTWTDGRVSVLTPLVVSGSLIANSYTILTSVSASLNFADDTAAAAGGVPLGGLYRNGNFVMIRLT